MTIARQTNTSFFLSFLILFYYNFGIRYIGYAAQHGYKLLCNKLLYPYF